MILKPYLLSNLSYTEYWTDQLKVEDWTDQITIVEEGTMEEIYPFRPKKIYAKDFSDI